MSVEEDIQELKDALAELRSENLGLRTRLSEVEDFAQTHVGMDWGQAGTDANSPHPNLSIDAAEYGGGVMRLNRYGDQVLMKTDGLIRPGLYFVKRLYSAEADFTSGEQQTTFGAGYSSTTAFSTWATYFTRDNILSGPFAYITEYARSASNGDPAAEILIAADYDGGGNAAELRIKEDSSGNLTYKIHLGYGVYADLGGGMNPIVKNTSETVNNSSTLQNDDELLFAVSANTNYQFEGVLHISTGGTPDFKLTFTGPSGATGGFSAMVNESIVISADLGSSASLTTISSGAIVRFWGGIGTSSTAGNLTLQWAQDTADASNTTVRAGSYIKWQTAR